MNAKLSSKEVSSQSKALFRIKLTDKLLRAAWAIIRDGKPFQFDYFKNPVNTSQFQKR